MKYENKYNLTPDQNRRFAKMNLTKLVFTNSRFEGVTTTLPQTQTIIDGLGVDGVPISDIEVIVQLKRGWQYIIENHNSLNLQIEKQINKIVALHDALIPGEIKSGNSEVILYDGETFKPDIPNEKDEEKYLDNLLSLSTTATDKALTLMYHNMRKQIFWDGNKRSATLAANKLMIDNGAGLINVPLDLWPQWNQLISDFYHTGEMTKVKEWTYDHGIQGIKLEK